MRRQFGIALVFLVTGIVFAASGAPSWNELDALAAQQIARADAKSVIEAANQRSRETMERCLPSVLPAPLRYDVILTIDAAGKVTDVTPAPGTRVNWCVVQVFKANALAAPPVAPFHIRSRVHPETDGPQEFVRTITDPSGRCTQLRYPVLKKRVEPSTRTPIKQAEATVRLHLDANGKPVDARIVSATDPDWGEAVRKAALQNRYDPATCDGQPIEYDLEFKVTRSTP